MTQKITPFLWFDDNAEAAVKFYLGVFKRSKIVTTACYSEAGAKASGRPKGSVMTIEFELEGQRFTAINGGPHYKINGAISFVVNCKNQTELDHYWKKLSAGGKEIQCGWLTDKFGVTWQIVPTIVGKAMADKDPAKSERVMQALLDMVKLDVKKLEQAYQGRQKV